MRHWVWWWASICIALGLALWGPLGLRGANAAPALACGLDSPQVMLANGQTAITQPDLPTSPPNQPTGFFPGTYAVGQTITLTEDLSRLPQQIDITAYHWAWDFGDGQTSSSFKTSHSYAAPGTYTIRLAFIDPTDSLNSDPNFDSASITIVAQQFSNPPIARISASDMYVRVGSELSYDASGSRSQVGGALTYTWDFNDASPEVQGVQVTHTFDLARTWGTVVTLIVTDARGATSVATVPVTVALDLPRAVLRASATSGHPGDAFTFDASASAPTSQAGDAIKRYQWDFGDGATATTTTALVTHSFRRAGTYLVKVRAFDAQGLPGTASVTLAISDPGLFGLGQQAPIILGSGAAIVLLLLGGVALNLMRERRAAQHRIAQAAARRALAQQRRAASGGAASSPTKDVLHH
jgi:PKD repeat protein